MSGRAPTLLRRLIKAGRRAEVRALISEALRETADTFEAAKRLGVSRDTMYRMAKEVRLNLDLARVPPPEKKR